MRNILIKMIQFYQKTPGPWHAMCRHTPTCSSYMIESLENYGVIKGIFLGMKRILRCNPFGTYGFDPVPKNENKKGRNL